jgi:CheY-like chemotaxis protein
MDGALVLVVDDSPLDRRLAGALLEKRRGLTARYAADGREALAVIEAERPDVVVTDMLMPEMNGLELVAAVRERYPVLPVVLMTAHGSEETAAAALRRGAASYVPKRNLAAELATTVVNVLALTRGERDEQRAYDALCRVEALYEIDNDLGAALALVRHLDSLLLRMQLCDQTERIQVGVALREALANAIYHGNLELSSTVRDESEERYAELAAERRGDAPYAARRVRVEVRQSRDEVSYHIADEGPGFDPRGLPDPTDPTNLEKVHGRGLLLIRTFMDEVRHNERGNEITLTRRRRPS